MLRIVANKRLFLTNDEFKEYQELVQRYNDPPKVRGEDLFLELFETNTEGLILFLRPPKRATSFEVIFFLHGIMQHQHLRQIHEQVDGVCKQVEERLAQLDTIYKQAAEELERLKSVSGKKKKNTVA